jgi:hypothetical protein
MRRLGREVTALKRPFSSGPLPPGGGIGCVLALSLMLALTVTGSGQTPSPSPREQVSKLDFLVGEWKGEGWRYGENGSKAAISQSTKVRVEADGSALRFKDTKKFRGDNLHSTPWYHPESTISYDEQAKLYRWRVVSAKRRGNPFEVRLPEPRTFQLVLHTRDGMVRTTIRVTEGGEWHETLEFLRSGGWFKSQETTLKRVK